MDVSTSSFCSSLIKPAHGSVKAEDQSLVGIVSPKQSNWLNHNADSFPTRVFIRNASVEEFRSDKNIFGVATPRASEKSERRLVNLPNEMETVTCFKDHANPTFADKYMNSSLDMLATNMDCFLSSSTVTYEAYNFPKWRKVSLTDSKFIAGNESDSSSLSYSKLANHERKVQVGMESNNKSNVSQLLKHDV
jgi:hypothetical protein